MSFAGLRDASPEEAYARIPEWQLGSLLGSWLICFSAAARGDSASLVSALVAYQFALDATSRDNAPRDWALTFNFAHALRTLGARQGDDIMLGAAIRAYRAVLEVRTRGADPLAWATTKCQLGQALVMLGERRSDRKVLVGGDWGLQRSASRNRS